jgi:hypothetical protein
VLANEQDVHGKFITYMILLTFAVN